MKQRCDGLLKQPESLSNLMLFSLVRAFDRSISLGDSWGPHLDWTRLLLDRQDRSDQ
mgnify:CR=1 FL=1